MRREALAPARPALPERVLARPEGEADSPGRPPRAPWAAEWALRAAAQERVELRAQARAASSSAKSAAGQQKGARAERRGAPDSEPAKSAVPGETRPAPIALIGVLSDTHGYLDPLILELFVGVDHIIHAGDIVDPLFLRELATLAPVTAVSGNIDTGELAAALPREASGEVAGVRFVVGHKRKRLLKRLAAGKLALGQKGAAPDLVVFGHEHMPSAAWVDGTLLLDPGTASSPDEEDDDPTVAIVGVEPTGLSVRFIPLARRRSADEGA
jgi:uncharacterized protein